MNESVSNAGDPVVSAVDLVFNAALARDIEEEERDASGPGVDVPPPPPIVSGAGAELVNRWVEGVHASHDAMQWAEGRRALEANKVALVVDSSGDGITPRWVFLDAIGEGRESGRFVSLTGAERTVSYAVPRDREELHDRIATGELKYVIPNTGIKMVKPAHLRENMEPPGGQGGAHD